MALSPINAFIFWMLLVGTSFASLLLTSPIVALYISAAWEHVKRQIRRIREEVERECE